MKKINLLPSLVTSFGLACGLFIIFRTNVRGIETYELLYTMTLILIIAGVADLLDGAIARAIKAESEMGLMLDSLADSISFGVAPAVLLLKALAIDYTSPLSFVAIAGAMIYTICGVYRLGRYNVQHTNVEENEEPDAYFEGLPIPTAAAAIIAPILLISAPYMQNVFAPSTEAKAIGISIWMVFIGYLMISHIKFFSLKSFHFSAAQFRYVLLGSVSVVLLLYGLLYFLPILLIALSWGYILLALLTRLIKR